MAAASFSWQRAGTALVGAIVPALVIVLWQAATALGWVNPQVLPSPLAVVGKWIEYLLPLQPYLAADGSWLAWACSGELIVDSLGSLYRVGVGFAIGAGTMAPTRAVPARCQEKDAAAIYFTPRVFLAATSRSVRTQSWAVGTWRSRPTPVLSMVSAVTWMCSGVMS